MKTPLEASVSNYIDIQNELNQVGFSISKLETAFEQLHQELYSKRNELKDSLLKAKDILNEKAVQEYGKTGEKKLYAGVGIQMRSKLIYQESDAFDWALEHKLALRLDAAAFGKIANTQDLEFVTKYKEPMATIPGAWNDKSQFNATTLKELE